MKTLKNILPIVVIVCVNFSAFTQTTKTSNNDELAQIIVNKYDKELTLTSVQKEALLKETKEYIKAMEETEKQADKNKEGKVSRKKQLTQDYEKRVDTLLTKEQTLRWQHKTEQKVND